MKKVDYVSIQSQTKDSFLPLLLYANHQIPGISHDPPRPEATRGRREEAEEGPLAAHAHRKEALREEEREGDGHT